MDEAILRTYEESLKRCNASPGFLERFYERFLASSPIVKEKFANTDFVHQKRALRASLQLMVLAAEDETKGPERYLGDVATTHNKAHLDIGAGLYDLWLDSILATVKEVDPAFSPEVEDAWEHVMTMGIKYLVSHYNDTQRGAGGAG
jgi:hemoglobin-like flavoprotein